MLSIRQRIKQIWVYTEDRFLGCYKGCEISIDRILNDDDIHTDGFDIQVIRQDGCYLYDGCYEPFPGQETMEDAIYEALKGSCLI